MQLRPDPGFDAQLVMPRLGQAIEPAQVQGVEPWWRGLDLRPKRPERAGKPTRVSTVAEPGAPVNPATMPWPLD